MPTTHGAVVLAVLALLPLLIGAQPVFRRVENGLCAEQGLGEYITVCPRWIVLYFGKLVPGTCAGAGFAHYHGDMRILAGPCGPISFRLYHAQPRAPPPGTAARAHPRARLCAGAMARRWWWCQKKTN